MDYHVTCTKFSAPFNLNLHRLVGFEVYFYVYVVVDKRFVDWLKICAYLMLFGFINPKGYVPVNSKRFIWLLTYWTHASIGVLTCLIETIVVGGLASSFLSWLKILWLKLLLRSAGVKMSWLPPLWYLLMCLSLLRLFGLLMLDQ